MRESIHAVESVANVLSGKEKATLRDGLRALKAKMEIHPAFEKGINMLYGYASDEKGIRHALLEDEAKADLQDALFMLGACASFVSYLIGKARMVGLLKE